MAVEPGARLAGRYVVEGPLGAGGMGVVVRAHDERLARAVAIKVLPANRTGDASSRARLLREARASAALEHAGIVHVYDVGETESGEAFLVMELVRGRTLRALLDDNALRTPQFLQIIVDVARALAFAHKAGFVHRDIKPDNVMVRDDGRTVVMDFGLAKSVLSDAGATVDAARDISLTAEGALVGTPAYLTPEQARGAPVDGRSDQFALAVMTYEGLTGRLPWRATTAIDVIAEILRDDVVPASSVTPGLPPAVDVVLGRALAKQPAHRFPDADAFGDAIAGLATEARTLPPHAPAAAYGATELAPPVGTYPNARVHEIANVARSGTGPRAAPPPSGMKGMGMRIAGAIALALVAAVAVRKWTHRHDERSSSSVSSVATSRDREHGVPSSLWASPSATVACPQLRVSGIDEPAGWLGAAAATLLCGRTQILLGGTSERTLIPAELLALPRTPVDEFPRDPYGDPDAREHERSVARAKATAWFDGEVTKRPHEMQVSLTLKTPDGDELARGKGSGRLLVHAVAAALESLKGSDPLPRPSAAAPWLASWLRVKTTEGALRLYDESIVAGLEDPAALHEECARSEGAPWLEPESAFNLSTECSYRLFRELPKPPASFDRSSPGSLRLVILADPSPTPEVARRGAAELHALFDKEPSDQGKALIAASEATLLMNTGANREAEQLLRRSIALDPKAAEPWSPTWRMLGFVASEKPSMATAAAWIPWDPFAVSSVGDVDKSPNAKVRYAQRAYILSPRGHWPSHYVDLLLEAGKLEEARSVAADTGSVVLEVEVAAAAGRFAAALEQATPLLANAKATPDSAVSTFSLARVAIAPALILGRPIDFADDLVKRFVDVEPPVLPRSYVPYLGLVATCTYAPTAVARRCLARLRALQARGQGFPGAQIAVLLAGAERYSQGDYVGAAKAWQPMLRDVTQVPPILRDAVAVTYDAVARGDLAEKVDATVASGRGRYNGADLAHVRAASRARRANDMVLAKKLAQTVVDAWSPADETVPSVAEMRRLLDKH